MSSSAVAVSHNNNNGSNSSSSSTTTPPLSYSSSSSSRCGELLHKTPVLTRLVVVLCTVLYLIFQVLLDIRLSTVTFCPQLILYHRGRQVYRIVTGVLFHSNIVHLSMNMISSLTLGTLLEQQIGTFPLFHTILLSIVVTSCLSIGTALLLSTIFQYEALMNQHSIGFSGILFHLSVLECHINSHIRRNLFGTLEIPSYLYPWVLLIVLQIMIPNLSFSGHLAGIVAGTMQAHGWLNMCRPNEPTFLQMDQQYQRYTSSSFGVFVPTNTSSILFTSSSSRCGRSNWTIHRILPSRFHTVIASMQQAFRRRFPQRDANDDDGDYDEWNGLPTALLPSSSKEPESLLV